MSATVKARPGAALISSQRMDAATGCDVLSFETDGRERLIEVKTTRFGALTPFFASKNEVAFSDSHKTQCHLYRLFRFRVQPRVFTPAGSLSVMDATVPAIVGGMIYWQRRCVHEGKSSLRPGFAVDSPPMMALQ
jgi:hypothetical protein